MGTEAATARVGIVVQRYGPEVNGGAEAHCRRVTERLARRHDVEVLTSRALDYVTWRDHYPGGVSMVNGVPVRRFSVRRERKSAEFDRFNSWLFANPHTREDERRWLELQGPDCPELLEYLEINRGKFDAFLFFTYLYLPTALGLPLVAERALLVPTAHDEPPIYLGVYDDVFRSARGLLFNTREESDFVHRRFCFSNRGEVVAVGIEPEAAPEPDAEWDRMRRRIGDSTVLSYVGRIEEGKGCGTLFEYFTEYLRNRPDANLKLLLLGRAVMQVPDHPAIIQAGFVPETTKRKAIAESRIVVIPSQYESLSLVALEAWTARRPVLVNGDCDVLRGQCRRANGGLWYRDRTEFCACLDRMLADEELCAALGRQGQAWAAREYCWERVDRCYDRLIAEMCAPNA